MPTTRPFAYNTGSTIVGTLQVGDLAIGVDPLDYSTNPGNVKWWMGPDEDLGYVITHTTLVGNQPNPLGIPAYLGFWRSESSTENSFIEISQYVSIQHGTPQSFTNGSDAKTWLNNNGYWTSFIPPVTPTPTVTFTQTPTNTITPSITPTITLTQTPTLTPSPSGSSGVDSLRSQMTTSLSSYTAANVNDWVKITSTEYNNIFNNIVGATKKGNTDVQINTRDVCAGFTEVQFSSNSDVNVPLIINAGEYPIAFISETWNGNSNVRFGYTTTFHTGSPTYGNSVSILPVQRNYYVRKAPNGIESAPATQTLYPALKIDGNSFNCVTGTRGWYSTNGGTTWNSWVNNIAKFQMIVTTTKSW